MNKAHYCTSNIFLGKTLLERDLDGSNYAVNHIVCDDHSIPLLNIGDVLSNIGAIFRSIYRLSKNKCVYLRLAKYLFPRDLDDC